MNSPPSGFEQLKQNMRGAWIAGDFGQIARHAEKGAEEFVNRLAIRPGMRVLDVACGTGNATLPAARKGARVTGVDIAPNLLEQARRKAAAEGLEVTFDEGDAEQLPYPDAGFDAVLSMFGAMFAPRPEKVVSELARVCRPGGLIAMANWTPNGFVGKMFALGARYVPPPQGVPPPVLWGTEGAVRERLGAATQRIETALRTIAFDYPYPPREVVQLFREYFGPTRVSFSKLDAAGQQAYAEELEALWREHNEGGESHTLVHPEYLEVVAMR